MATELGVAYVAIVPTTKGMATAIGKEISGSAVASAAKTGGQHIGTNLASSVRSVLSGNMHISDVAISAGKSIGSHLADGVKQAGGLIADGMKSAVMLGGKAAIGAIGGLTAGIGMLGKAAVEGFADYQQFTGGISKLFGTAGQSLEEYAASTGQTTEEAKGDWLNLLGAQREVFSNARDAYKTAGLDQNTYMQTVTGFSASLIKSLGGDTKAAANLADRAIRDMSDNANTFGTDMSTLQAAYQGFARGNFNMLDQLSLGFGGSKEGMEDLIATANSLREANGEMADLTIDSFADIVTAINTVQDAQGIMDTTAKEAAGTVSGSINMMQAAWRNFVIDLGGSGEVLDETIQGLTESITAVISNVMPVISSFVVNLTEALPQILPKILDAVNEIIAQLLVMIPELIPPLIDAILQTLQTLVDALPTILPALIDGMVQIIVGIAQMLPTLMPILMDAAKQLFTALVDALPLILPALIDATVALVMAAVDLLPTLIPQLLSAAIQLFMALVEAVGRIVGELLGKVGEVIGQAVGKVSGSAGEMLSAAVEWFMGLLKGAQQVVADVINFVANIPGNILAALGNLGSLLWDAGGQIINGLLGGLQAAFGGVMDFVGGIAGWIFEHKGPLEYDATLLVKNGAVIMEGLETGLREGYKDVQRFVAGVGTNIQATVTGEVSNNQSTTAGFGGVLITGNTFNVRSESDIDRISDALARKINRDAWAVV